LDESEKTLSGYRELMMKLGVGILVAVAALLAVAPYFIGGKIESGAGTYIEQYQVPGYEYRVEVDRGYSSSVLTYRLGLDPSILAPSADISAEQAALIDAALAQLKIRVYVQHGPLLTQNGFGLGLADVVTSVDGDQFPMLADYLALAGVDELFAASGRLNFDGSGEFNYEVPAMQYLDQEIGIEASYSGLLGILYFEDLGRFMSSEAHSGGGKFVIEGISFVDVGPMNMTHEMAMDQDSIWFGTGSADFEIESLVFSSPDQTGSLDGLRAGMQMFDGDTPESTSIAYSLEFDGLDSDGLQLENALVALAYENLSKKSLENYLNLAMAMDFGDEQAAQAVLVQFAIDELPQALLHNPAISVPRISFTHQGRSFEGSLRTALDGQMVSNPIDFQRPDLLLPALTAELHLDADESLINDLVKIQAASIVDASFVGSNDFNVTAEMRQTMIEQQASMTIGIAASQGFLLRKNGRIRTNLGLENRILDINGTLMPLPF
jgi:uncharacterized protein YdgA (DUF945 family)